jgi:selenocysteine lyase/cysteine desulfurase
MTQVGGTAGRGTYAEACEGARVIATCRRRICDFIHGESPDHVVFGLNTSDALNLAIGGIVAQRRIDSPSRPIHLVTTALDHNSVLRPYTAHADIGVEWTCVSLDPVSGVVDPDQIKAAIRSDTALVAINHASNVTGAIQPAARIGAICRERGVLFLLDAAQSLGHIEVDAQALNADLLAIPGHKGLLGPLGTGALYLRPGVERQVRPVRVGGTGSKSESETHPTTMPDRYEPGSQNAVGIAGLSEAVAWLLERKTEILRHDREIRALMLDGLRTWMRLGRVPARAACDYSGPQTRMPASGSFR